MAVPPDGGGGRACDSGKEGECGALDANAPPFGRSCIPIGVPESCMNLDCARAPPNRTRGNWAGKCNRMQEPNGTARMSTSTRDWSAMYVMSISVRTTKYVQVRKKKGGQEANSPIWEADRGFQSARVSSLTHPLSLIRRSLDWIGLDDENKKGKREKKNRN